MVTRFSRGQTLTLTVGLGPGQINPRETESKCSVVKENQNGGKTTACKISHFSLNYSLALNI